MELRQTFTVPVPVDRAWEARFIVHRAVADEFTRRFAAAVTDLKVGDPTDPANAIGPMARADLVDELERQVHASVQAGQAHDPSRFFWGCSGSPEERLLPICCFPGHNRAPRQREGGMTQATQPCQHVVGLQPPPRPGDICQDCAPLGATWVSLRQCMACGHVGCCDSSPNRHARAHFEGVGHPVIRSAMPGDNWWFCFPDELTVRPEPDGRIVPLDLWWEAGIASVRRLLAEQPTAELTAEARTANGFPVGEWAEQQRQAHAAGTLPPERVEAL
jgi:hypothetical protein